MKKLLLLLFILSLPAYAIETQDDPLAEFSEETISTYNDKMSSVIDDLEGLEDDITTNTPSGIIVMWSGAVSAIPSGWVICDGTNSTPDLTDRFVIHADSDSGGTNDVGDTGGSKTISIANLPAHKHTFVQQSGSAGSGAYHSSPDVDGTASYVYSDPARDTSSVGSGTAYMPKYFALAFIMKL